MRRKGLKPKKVFVMPAPIVWPGSRNEFLPIELPVSGGEPIRFEGILVRIDTTPPVPDLQPGEAWDRASSKSIPRWWEVATYQDRDGRTCYGSALQSVLEGEGGFRTAVRARVAGSPLPEDFPFLPPGVGPSLEHDPTGQLARRRRVIESDLRHRLSSLFAEVSGAPASGQ